MPSYIQTHTKLSLISLDQFLHSRTCSYWYLIQTACTAHTAFRTRAAALFWLEARGLPAPDAVPAPGTHHVVQIAGSYRTALSLEPAEWASLRHRAGYVGDILSLDNGQYTVGVVTKDEDGIRTIHTLNPSCPRTVFDWRRASKAADLGGWLTSRSNLGFTHSAAGMVPIEDRTDAPLQ